MVYMRAGSLTGSSPCLEDQLERAVGLRRDKVSKTQEPAIEQADPARSNDRSTAGVRPRFLEAGRGRSVLLERQATRRQHLEFFKSQPQES